MLPDVLTKDKKTVVEMIHADFDTAEERLAKYSERIVKNQHPELMIKHEKLSKLGFGGSIPAKIGAAALKNLADSTEYLENVKYFKAKYPIYRFITEDEVKRLCAKYGLVLGESNRYIGEIPDKNIEEITAFKLKEEDFYEDPFRGMFQNFALVIPGRKKDERVGVTSESKFLWYEPGVDKNRVEEKEKPRFKIVAPLNKFDRTNTSVKDNYLLEVNIPDPIVLQPVKGGYLIVSKWGLEGSDSAVVNHDMN